MSTINEITSLLCTYPNFGGYQNKMLYILHPANGLLHETTCRSISHSFLFSHAQNVGYVFGSSTRGQRALYEVGLTGIPISNCNNNCSTGSTAIFQSRSLVAGGLARCALALGFEKMQVGGLMYRHPSRLVAQLHHFLSMYFCNGRKAHYQWRMRESTPWTSI